MKKLIPTPSSSHSGGQPIPLDYCMTMVHVTTDMITCCKQQMRMRTNLVTSIWVKGNLSAAELSKYIDIHLNVDNYITA